MVKPVAGLRSPVSVVMPMMTIRTLFYIDTYAPDDGQFLVDITGANNHSGFS
jgi:hypothetical protein